MDRFLTKQQRERLKTVNPSWMQKDQYRAEMTAIYSVLPDEIIGKTADVIWENCKAGKTGKVDIYNAKQFNDEQREKERLLYKEGFKTIPIGVPQKLETEQEIVFSKESEIMYKKGGGMDIE